MNVSRISKINQEQYKDQSHHSILDPVQLRVVRLRHGLETGKPMTLAETAKALKTSVPSVKRIEDSVVAKIDERIEGESSAKEVQLLMKAKELQRRIEELEHAVRSIDMILPQVKMRRRRRKSS